VKLKFLFFLTISCILSLGSLLLYESLRLYYVALAKPLKQIEYDENSKTGSLKILTHDGKLIFMEKYGFIDELSRDDITDRHIKALEFSEFDILDYYRKNYFPKLSSLTQYETALLAYLNTLERYFLNVAIKKYLSEEYSVAELYLYLINSVKYSADVTGAGGLAKYLTGKKFSQLHFKTQMFLIFTMLNILEEKEKGFPEIMAEIDSILWELYRKGIISDEFYRDAANSGVHFKKYKTVSSKKYQKLVEAVKDELRNNLINVRENNYEVYLGYDERLNKLLQRKVNEYILTRKKDLNAAYVVIDYKEGVVRGIYGTKSGNYRDIFSRPLYMKRQTGSIFKPFVYVTAFENGVKPYDLIADRKEHYSIVSGIYSPKNYDDFYMGKTYVRNGLIYSLNNATVKLAVKTGLKNIALTAKAFGLESVKPYFSMPLGAIPFSVLEMAKAYSVFANNGVKREIAFIGKIFENGKQIEIQKKEKKIVSERSAGIILDCMKDVVRFGTANKSGLMKDTAGKTGTTNNYRDAWFAEIMEPYVVIAWVGYDDMRSMGEKGTGGSMAAPLVANLQKYLYSDKSYSKYTQKKE